jgi:hypothetical protein
LYKAVLLTLSISLGSVASGAVFSTLLLGLSGAGFATAFPAFVQSLARSTTVSPGVSIVPDVPKQVEAAAEAIEAVINPSNEKPPKPSPTSMVAAIVLSNMRPISLVPAIHAVMPLAMVLEGRGSPKPIGRRHERFILASALSPMAVNGFTMGGVGAEYPILAPLLALEALSLSFPTYIASKALCSDGRGFGRLAHAYRGAHRLFLYAVLVALMAAAYETHISTVTWR